VNLDASEYLHSACKDTVKTADGKTFLIFSDNFFPAILSECRFFGESLRDAAYNPLENTDICLRFVTFRQKEDVFAAHYLGIQPNCRIFAGTTVR
jgi:hypothetical protein